MKTQKTLVCGFLAVMFAMSFGAYTAAAQEQRLTGTDSFKFTVINSGTAYRVSAGTATEGTVNIPTYYRPNANSDYLPVKEIGENAFLERVNIIKITIPSTVTSIGKYAFAACTNLTAITIPASVTSIGEGAFGACTSLASITIPAGVTSIDNWPFYGCTSLASITVASNNPNYASEGGILYNKTKTAIIAYPTASGNITIPAGITSIDGAFMGCTSLTSITIPAGITSIGTVTFANCTSLASITIPTDVTEIGVSAFAKCTSLASITIPAGVTTIDGFAFGGWSYSQTINVQGKANQAAADSAWGESWRSDCRAKIVYQR